MPVRQKRRLATAILAAGIGLSSSLVAAPQASAGCVTQTYYTVTASATRIPFAGVPTFKNGPGGTMTVTKSYSGTASYQVTAGAESEVGAVLAKAKVSISASLTLSNSTSATNSYTQKITAGKYGNARYVSWGQTVSWKKYRDNATCTTTYLSAGTIRFPSTKEGWYYWETSS